MPNGVQAVRGPKDGSWLDPPSDWERDSFVCPSLRAQRNFVRQSILGAAPLICLEGPRGVGKSGIAAYACGGLDRSAFDVVPIALVAPQERSGWLWPMLNNFLGRDSRDVAAGGDDSTGALQRLQDGIGQGRRLVLWIDGGENLVHADAMRELIGLANLRTLAGSFLTMLLVVDRDGQTSAWHATDAWLGDALRVSCTHLEREEIRQYLEWRFARAPQDVQARVRGADLERAGDEVAGNLLRAHGWLEGWARDPAGTARRSSEGGLRALLPPPTEDR